MKKNNRMKAGILGIVMVAAISINLVSNKEKDEFSPLMLANIEALAENEGLNGTSTLCWGTGDVICPITGKEVKNYVTQYSLE